MPSELLTQKDRIIERLTPVEGKELEISCNLTSNKQMDLFVEQLGFSKLGSTYIIERGDMLKRLTCSFQGRNRTDLVEIGKAPEWMQQQRFGGFDDH